MPTLTVDETINGAAEIVIAEFDSWAIPATGRVLSSSSSYTWYDVPAELAE